MLQMSLYVTFTSVTAQPIHQTEMHNNEANRAVFWKMVLYSMIITIRMLNLG